MCIYIIIVWSAPIIIDRMKDVSLFILSFRCYKYVSCAYYESIRTEHYMTFNFWIYSKSRSQIVDCTLYLATILNSADTFFSDTFYKVTSTVYSSLFSQSVQSIFRYASHFRPPFFPFHEHTLSSTAARGISRPELGCEILEVWLWSIYEGVPSPVLLTLRHPSLLFRPLFFSHLRFTLLFSSRSNDDRCSQLPYPPTWRCVFFLPSVRITKEPGIRSPESPFVGRVQKLGVEYLFLSTYSCLSLFVAGLARSYA